MICGWLPTQSCESLDSSAIQKEPYRDVTLKGDPTNDIALQPSRPYCNDTLEGKWESVSFIWAHHLIMEIPSERNFMSNSCEKVSYYCRLFCKAIFLGSKKGDIST